MNSSSIRAEQEHGKNERKRVEGGGSGGTGGNLRKSCEEADAQSNT